jgi:hypothetical protein
MRSVDIFSKVWKTPREKCKTWLELGELFHFSTQTPVENSQKTASFSTYAKNEV